MARAQQETTPTHPIDRILEQRPEAWWGVMVINLSSRTEVYTRNADRLFMPASVTKLFTTAAALDQLGPDFRYETRLYVAGPVEDSVLAGNLIVRGAGDPVHRSPRHGSHGPV